MKEIKTMKMVRMVEDMVSNLCQDLADLIQYKLYPSKRRQIIINRVIRLVKSKFKKLWQKLVDIFPSFYFRSRKRNLLFRIKKNIIQSGYVEKTQWVILIILIIYLIIKFIKFFFFSPKRKEKKLLNFWYLLLQWSIDDVSWYPRDNTRNLVYFLFMRKSCTQ